MLEKDTLRLISLMLFAIYTSTTVYGDTDSQSKKLTDFAFKNKVGNQDYLLQIETSYGWENVALFFGYWDDYEACLEMIEGQKAIQFNPRRYRCIPANRD